MLCSRAQWWIRKIVSLDHIFKPLDQQLGSLTIRFPPLHVYFFLSSMVSSGSHKQAQKQCRSEEQRCFCHCTAETLRDASSPRKILCHVTVCHACLRMAGEGFLFVTLCHNCVFDWATGLYQQINTVCGPACLFWCFLTLDTRSGAFTLSSRCLFQHPGYLHHHYHLHHHPLLRCPLLSS